MEFIIKIDSSTFDEDDVAMAAAYADNDLRFLMADALYNYIDVKKRQASKGRTEILNMVPEPIDYTLLEKEKVDYHLRKAAIAEVLRQGALLAKVKRVDRLSACQKTSMVCWGGGSAWSERNSVLSYSYYLQDRIVEEPGFPHINRCGEKFAMIPSPL